MTSKPEPAGCIKFTLSLNAKTSRKRLSEAMKKLEGLYPFEADEKKILIFRTDKKECYDVYLSNEEIKSRHDMKKICLAAVSSVLVLACLITALRHAALKSSEYLTAQRELERQKQEATEIQKKKEEKLLVLKSEYDRKKIAEYEKIYPSIERIYSAMKGKTTIENISIQKNDFTVEAVAEDAAGTLSNFEGSQAFAFVKMNRTTVRNGEEKVTYSGGFSKFRKEANEKVSLDDRIKFYETELLKMKSRSEAKRQRTVSEYIKSMRDALRKNSCSEQYIQLKGNDGSAEIEFFILSESKNILNFIKEIQTGEDSLIDIKSFVLRNNGRLGQIQATICFDTGIELSRNGSMLPEYAAGTADVSEIDRIFHKVQPAKTAAIKTPATRKKASAEKDIGRTAPVRMKKLSYVGLAKSGGTDFVIAKDDEMESIYNLALSDTETETDGNFCVKSGGIYRAKIRGEYYEVKK